MRIAEMMTRDVQVVRPDDSLQKAAKMMDDLNVGALPVCDGQKLVGMVTDRDIAIRGVSAGKAPDQCHVDEVMSGELRWCFEDEEVEEVVGKMADSQIRRVPVVSRDKKLVGIVSLGDLATRQQPQLQGVLKDISQPSHPDR